MKRQKFILHSKTIWSTLITLALAVLPHLLDGVEQGFSEEQLGTIIAVTATSLWTIYNRYIAQGSLYTPNGIPGRSYVPFRERD